MAVSEPVLGVCCRDADPIPALDDIALSEFIEGLGSSFMVELRKGRAHASQTGKKLVAEGGGISSDDSLERCIEMDKPPLAFHCADVDVHTIKKSNPPGRPSGWIAHPI